MSLQPRPWPEVPAQTAQVAKKAFRRGALAIRARDELGAWYDDAGFAGAYGVRGAPGISPAQLAMVTVLQFCENLTGRQAADAVRGRLDWRYCLGLALACRLTCVLAPGLEGAFSAGGFAHVVAGCG